MTPASFTELKRKIEQSPILSAQEKKEWLFFLPHMTAEHIKELDRILSLKLPAHMPDAKTANPEQPVKPGIRYQVSGNQAFPPEPKALSFELQKIHSLSVEDLRRASSVYVFLEELGKKMRELIRQKQASLEQITEAFEGSTLYRAYVEAGFQMLSPESDEGPATLLRQEPLLSRPEFEAIADFRARFRKILS